MGKPLNSPASFRPISFTSCVPKLFERIILSRLLFFLKSNCVLSPRQAGFRPGRSTCLRLLILSGIRSLSETQLASLLALFVGLNLSFLAGPLAWSSKLQKLLLLTHFALSYEQALRFLTSFPFLAFASLGGKTRLSTSSWRTFETTHMLMLPTFPRKVLFACPPSLTWNLFFCRAHSFYSLLPL